MLTAQLKFQDMPLCTGLGSNVYVPYPPPPTVILVSVSPSNHPHVAPSIHKWPARRTAASSWAEAHGAGVTMKVGGTMPLGK